MKYNIYQVNDDYVVATNAEEAVNAHLDAIGKDWYKDVNKEVEVNIVNANTKINLENDNGYYELQTFQEYLSDYNYVKPEIIAWQE